MVWNDNKTLLEYSKRTPCKEIFQAVCDELGKHYAAKGFKYSRSRPKLTLEIDDIKLVIEFWSTKSNTPGKSVSFEILPNFYSKQLAKTSTINGFLFGHTGLFYHKYTDNPKQILVKQIFGDQLERIDEYSTESNIIENHYCNVYGIDKEKFDSIVKFIDDKIVIWISKLATNEGILELITNACRTRVWAINGKGTNSDFVNYVKLHFSDIDIEEKLGL
ncbi:hypothetical protein [Flavobacterium sp. LC2016-01]|uniref:hypothetical protein n=1 Tax=Flavobacterium sp. LC2016-01 TaxID=2675876 RepID=UPI0012BAC65C|nr:hypothetical protein [Flavobacterium sp. LC2016-01]MTH14142.1 hypothetical protein [Flavobacterium sp. LC2016-01]